MGGAGWLLGAVRRARTGALGVAGRQRFGVGHGSDQFGAVRQIVGVQQALDRHVDEIRIGDIAVAVGVHQPAGLAEQVPALRVIAVLGDGGVLQQAQALQNRGPARRRIGDAHDIDPIGPAQAGAGLGPVGLEIGQGQQSRHWALTHLGHDGLGDRAFQQRPGPLGGDLADGGGIGRVLQDVARLDLGPVGLGEIGDGVWGCGLATAASRGGGHATRDRKAAIGQTLGLAEQVLPGQFAVLRLSQRQHGDGARRAGRPAAEDRHALVQRLAVVAIEQLRRRRHRGGFATVVGGHGLGLRVVVGQERAAAQARALRLHQAQRRLHRHRRIHRRTAGAQHLQARLHRHRIGGGHHAGRRRSGLRGRHLRRRARRQSEGESQGYEGGRQLHGTDSSCNRST